MSRFETVLTALHYTIISFHKKLDAIKKLINFHFVVGFAGFALVNRVFTFELGLHCVNGL